MHNATTLRRAHGEGPAHHQRDVHAGILVLSLLQSFLALLSIVLAPPGD